LGWQKLPPNPPTTQSQSQSQDQSQSQSQSQSQDQNQATAREQQKARLKQLCGEGAAKERGLDNSVVKTTAKERGLNSAVEQEQHKTRIKPAGGADDSEGNRLNQHAASSHHDR
jgi:hypothetical protein